MTGVILVGNGLDQRNAPAPWTTGEEAPEARIRSAGGPATDGIEDRVLDEDGTPWTAGADNSARWVALLTPVNASTRQTFRPWIESYVESLLDR